MQARFLLGPAGSGKTHRCLAEIRAELIAQPDGPPLVLLAPKQATFQLERQLLASPELAGYTRLRILSFERLAGFILDMLRISAPDRLSEEGRLMVLRALLARQADKLELFRASARLPGFAQQLNLVLRELQHHHLLPERLEELAARAHDKPHLQAKLRDLARLLGAYLNWLDANRLQDTDVLLDFAAEALLRAGAGFHLGGLWLDGFAEMTPQELRLLAAVLPHCEQALLAFCLESQPREELPWLSTWSVVSQTFRECKTRVESLSGAQVPVDILRRDAAQSRFAAEPAFAHLEARWTQPLPFEPSAVCALHGAVRLVACRDREVEAVLAAHEILRYVRNTGGRFRDCAVLLRSFEGYHDSFRRVFARCGIPAFLDRRESVSHHPLAELTRFSLRVVAFGWKNDDWFGALKTGLVRVGETELDRLENAALEYGWEGDAWRHALRVTSEPLLGEWAEALRVRLVAPFRALSEGVRGEVSGRELASALRAFWDEVKVEETLERWSAELAAPVEGSPAVHDTVWNQMHDWLENLELAFPAYAMRVGDWLPILEAGLANLSVGVIPPALDQVLIGTVDRSRNPELQIVILPGFNEAVFPAPLPFAGLLTESERDALAGLGARLGPGALRRIGHERYYGYIACTRPRRRLVVTHARRDDQGGELHPSAYIAHLKKLFPTLLEESVDTLPENWLEAEHPSELIAPLLRDAVGSRLSDEAHAERQNAESKSRNEAKDSVLLEPHAEGDRGPQPSAPTTSDLGALLALPALAHVRALLERLPQYPKTERLSPALAEALHWRDSGGVRAFHSSVSRLETFAACPFRFFVEAGLRAEERKQFEVDQRERGTLQHEVLERFHYEITGSGRRWRDVLPDEAVALIGRLVDKAAATYRDGLFQDDERNQLTAAALKESLQRFIRVAIGWMRSYQLDPTFVELKFGMPDSALPAWRIPLGDGRELALRGKVDRVDLGAAAAGAPWCVVLDYKSAARKLDAVQLHNGLTLQLPAYLAAIECFAREGRFEGVVALRPAGMFYANLRGSAESGESRDDVLTRDESERAAAYRHFGRFNMQAVSVLDAGAADSPSGQFSFRLNKDGTLSRQHSDPMDADAFAALLAGTRQRLAEFGQRILAGDASIDPYRHGSKRSCDHCELASVCRIELRTHRFRALEKP